MKTKITSVYLNGETMSQIKYLQRKINIQTSILERKQISASMVVRIAVEEYFKNFEKNKEKD